jgi:hypothetical protein
MRVALALVEWAEPGLLAGGGGRARYPGGGYTCTGQNYQVRTPTGMLINGVFW